MLDLALIYSNLIMAEKELKHDAVSQSRLLRAQQAVDYCIRSVRQEALKLELENNKLNRKLGN